MQKFLSYLVGWISVLGWQTGLASITFIAGTLIQGLIVLNVESYVFERWHGTLLVIAIVAFAVLFNTLLAKRLPMIEGMVLILHLAGFFGVLIPLWVLAPRNSAAAVFTQFENLGGWSTQGLSFMVGLLTSVYGLLGADSAIHMSEEIRDASIVLPRATMWSILVNGGFGWIMVITFAFTCGNPLDIVSSQTGYPFISAFYNATGSKAGASVMVAIMIVNTTSSVISTLATVSRQLWSFGRDRGVPASGFISHVSGPGALVCDRFTDNTPPKGQTWLEHPAQLRPHHLLLHLHPLAHQHRQHRRLQRRFFHGHQRPAHHVHHLHRVRGHSPREGPAAARPPMGPGPYGLTDQHHRPAVLDLDLDLLVLPANHPAHAVHHELERADQRRRDRAGRHLLHREGQACVRGTRHSDEGHGELVRTKGVWIDSVNILPAYRISETARVCSRANHDPV